MAFGWGWEALMKENPTYETVLQWNKKMKACKPEAFDWGKPIPDEPLAQGFDYYFVDGTINFAGSKTIEL